MKGHYFTSQLTHPSSTIPIHYPFPNPTPPIPPTPHPQPSTIHRPPSTHSPPTHPPISHLPTPPAPPGTRGASVRGGAHLLDSPDDSDSDNEDNNDNDDNDYCIMPVGSRGGILHDLWRVRLDCAPRTATGQARLYYLRKVRGRMGDSLMNDNVRGDGVVVRQAQLWGRRGCTICGG